MLWLYEATRNVFWTGVRISPPPPKVLAADKVPQSVRVRPLLMGGVLGFDRVNSTEVDNSPE